MTEPRTPIDPALAAQVRQANKALDVARSAAMAERADVLARLQREVPAELQARAQWLLWRYEVVADRPATLRKPAKVPYYCAGSRRFGDIGSEGDLRRLTTMAVALDRFSRSSRWDGVGFTFLAGDGLIGVDVDHAVDAGGQPSDLCRTVVEGLASYTELSPSGTGVHVLVAGTCDTFKDDRIGLEVYAGGRYFTMTGRRCTGAPWPDTPAELRPADPDVLAYMRELVDASKEQQREERRALQLVAFAGDACKLPPGLQAPADAAAAQPAAACADLAPSDAQPASAAEARPQGPGRAPRPRQSAAPVPQGSDDFKRVNDAAMASLQAWVPALFSEAERKGSGYRVTSKALGRDLQEDLSIQPIGIVDYGVHDMGDAREGKRTPVDLVLEWGHRVGVAADKPGDAMRWLAQVMGVAVAPRIAKRAEPPPAGPHKRASAPQQGEGRAPEAGPDAADDGAPAGPEDEGPPDDDADADDLAELAEGGGRKGKIPAEVWERVDALSERFALIYGTETAWDCVERVQLKISAMRLAFDRVSVNLWLSRSTRRTVRPSDLVFEPGLEVGGQQINMFGGLQVEPTPCEPADVEPMLALLRHLCSETRIKDAEGRDMPSAVDDAMHWVLCWQALPLQRLGTKMASALVVHGAQGTGKNLYFDAWRDLFGTYGVTVTQTELEEKFNAWLSCKMAIVGDEVVSRQEMYHNKNKLKLIVTQHEKFAIRPMHMDLRWETNHANVVFLSNESEPLVLEDRDRRYMVIYTPLEAPTELYQRVRAFMDDGGLSKWLYYLQAYDLGDFEAHTKPPVTAAKAALIEASWRPAARFAHEWIEGYTELPVRVCSAEQLYRGFRWWCDKTGERWPPSQPKFTAEVNRWASERRSRGADGIMPAPVLTYKVIALVESATRRKAVRCFIPLGCHPPVGVAEGAWAWDSVSTFEHDLYKFVRRGGGLSDSEGGDQ